jgi:hypothetical protein
MPAVSSGAGDVTRLVDTSVPRNFLADTAQSGFSGALERLTAAIFSNCIDHA